MSWPPVHTHGIHVLFMCREIHQNVCSSIHQSSSIVHQFLSMESTFYSSNRHKYRGKLGFRFFYRNWYVKHSTHHERTAILVHIRTLHDVACMVKRLENVQRRIETFWQRRDGRVTCPVTSEYVGITHLHARPILVMTTLVSPSSWWWVRKRYPGQGWAGYNFSTGSLVTITDTPQKHAIHISCDSVSLYQTGRLFSQPGHWPGWPSSS